MHDLSIARGDANAASELLPVVYQELRSPQPQLERSGRADVAGDGAGPRGPLRLVGNHDSHAPNWSNRGHFFAAAAEAMREF